MSGNWIGEDSHDDLGSFGPFLQSFSVSGVSIEAASQLGASSLNTYRY